MSVNVYEVTVKETNKDVPLKRFHFIATTMLEASHIAETFIFDEGIEFEDIPAEIAEIKQLSGVVILNAGMRDDHEHEYDFSLPIELAKELPDSETMKFKCSCGNEIRCINSNWPALKCPECENLILRREIENVGGMFLYTKLDKR